MTILEFFLWSLLKVVVVTVVLLLGVAYTVLLERKLVGRIQNRWGPSRVGPFGLLQPLVDGAKSFLKEDIIPSSVYRPLYLLAPILALGCALMSIAVVPFGFHTFGSNTTRRIAGCSTDFNRTSTGCCAGGLLRTAKMLPPRRSPKLYEADSSASTSFNSCATPSRKSSLLKYSRVRAFCAAVQAATAGFVACSSH